MTTGPLLVAFIGGTSGQWLVERIQTIRGEGLEPVERLDVREGRDPAAATGSWVLRGATSNEPLPGGMMLLMLYHMHHAHHGRAA